MMNEPAHIKVLLDQDPPAVHGAGSYGISQRVIETIARYVPHGAVTAETGSGISTLIIAALGARHLAITPAEEEAAQIRAWLQRNNISTDTLSFDHRLSWDALPGLSASTLDFAFIDGCHGFPVPFLDFFYMARGLKVGGTLGIDDVQIWTGKVLVEFLTKEPTWEFLTQLDKTVFFKKVGALAWNEWEWDKQPFVVMHSRPSFARRLLGVLDLVRRALKHLLTGDTVKLKRGLNLIFGVGRRKD